MVSYFCLIEILGLLVKANFPFVCSDGLVMLFSGEMVSVLQGVPSVRRWGLTTAVLSCCPYFTQRSPDEGEEGGPLLTPFGVSARTNGCRGRGKGELAHHTQ